MLELPLLVCMFIVLFLHTELHPICFEDSSLVWVDQETLDTTSILASKGGLDRSFVDVGLLFDWGLLILKEDKRVCSKYNGHVILPHECLFYLIGFCLPFNVSEIGGLNHLLIVALQLHSLS